MSTTSFANPRYKPVHRTSSATSDDDLHNRTSPTLQGVADKLENVRKSPSGSIYPKKIMEIEDLEPFAGSFALINQSSCQMSQKVIIYSDFCSGFKIRDFSLVFVDQEKADKYVLSVFREKTYKSNGLPSQISPSIIANYAKLNIPMSIMRPEKQDLQQVAKEAFASSSDYFFDTRTLIIEDQKQEIRVDEERKERAIRALREAISDGAQSAS